MSHHAARCNAAVEIVWVLERSSAIYGLTLAQGQGQGELAAGWLLAGSASLDVSSLFTRGRTRQPSVVCECPWLSVDVPREPPRVVWTKRAKKGTRKKPVRSAGRATATTRKPVPSRASATWNLGIK